ncbi:MAG: hypothetical protein ACRDPG_12450 [Nocardioidaceae bacterium]
MTISRRALLTTSAVGLAGVALTNPAEALSRGPAPLISRPRARFPGDPGRGHLYYGSSLPSGRSLPAWESRLGCHLGVHHNYFRPQNIDGIVRHAHQDVVNHRLPHISITPPGSWRSMASGRYDGWINHVLHRLAHIGRPVFVTVNPEPESDTGPGCTPTDFIEMQNRLILKNAAIRGSHVTIVPVLMAWSFNPHSGRHINHWYPQRAKLIGVDVYNPWGPHNGGQWRSLAQLMPSVLKKAGSKPIVIAEYGCRTNPAHPALAVKWMTDAYNFAVRHNVVSMGYFNSNVSSPDGTWMLDRVRGPVFRELLRTKTARIR